MVVLVDAAGVVDVTTPAVADDAVGPLSNEVTAVLTADAEVLPLV